MPTIKCPACGHPIALETQSADGKVSCGGCGKNFALRRKDPAAAPAPAHPPAAPIRAASVPPPQSAAPPPHRPVPRPAHHPAARPGGPVRPVLRRSAPPVQEDFGDSGADGEENAGARPHRRKSPVPIIAGIGGGVALLGLVFLLVNLYMGSIRKAERDVADRMVLPILSLKWAIEAQAVKEAEAAWPEFRQKHMAQLPPEVDRKELGLRVWAYEKRSQQLLDWINEFMSLMDTETNQLLYAKASEINIHAQDAAIDWLAWRGYRIYGNLKKSPTGGAAPVASVGGKREIPSGGILNAGFFGTPVQADFDRDPSYIDTTAGILRMFFKSNYAGYLDPSGGPTGQVFLSGKRVQFKYLFDFRKEILDYFANGGRWATAAFEESGGKSAPVPGQ